MIHTGPYVEKCSRKGVERFVRDEIASGDHVTLLRTVDICQARAVNTVKAHVAGTTESFWEHLEIYLPVAKGYVISSFARVQVLDLVQVRIPGRRRGRVAGRARPGGSCKMASSLLSSPSSLSCDGFLAPLCCAHLFELFLFFGKPIRHKPCLPHERAICRRTPPAQSGNAGKGPRDPHGVPCEPDRGHDGGWRCAFAC